MPNLLLRAPAVGAFEKIVLPSPKVFIGSLIQKFAFFSLINYLMYSNYLRRAPSTISFASIFPIFKGDVVIFFVFLL